MTDAWIKAKSGVKATVLKSIRSKLLQSVQRSDRKLIVWIAQASHRVNLPTLGIIDHWIVLFCRARFRRMPRKSASKTKLTDAERHKLFVEMAHKVQASNDPKDFDKAFKKIVTPKFAKK